MVRFPPAQVFAKTPKSKPQYFSEILNRWLSVPDHKYAPPCLGAWKVSTLTTLVVPALKLHTPLSFICIKASKILCLAAVPYSLLEAQQFVFDKLLFSPWNGLVQWSLAVPAYTNLIREVSLCSGQWLTQKQLAKVQRISVCGVVFLNRISVTHTCAHHKCTHIQTI